MKKKEYSAPEVKVVKLQQQYLLSSSPVGTDVYGESNWADDDYESL